MTQNPPRRAVLLEIPPVLTEWRKRTGANRHDEMWEGVLHMGPSPTVDHQDFEFHLEAWLRQHWAKATGGKVFHERNVARSGLAEWQHDYRVPDLVLILPARSRRERGTHFDGGPNVVVEIRSPGDESYDKLPFYFDVEVEEVWIIDRDTKVPELFVRGANAFRKAKANRGGWLVSKATGIEMRAAEGGRLALRLADAPASEALLPEE